MHTTDPVRERFRRRLNRSHPVGWHLAGLFALTVALGLAANRLWWSLGFDHLILRSAANCLLTYGLFLGLVRVWVAVVHWSRPELAALTPAEAAAALPDAPTDWERAAKRDATAPDGAADLLRGAAELATAGTDVADFFVAGVALLAAALVAAGLALPALWAEIPGLLTEAAFQVALSASLVRRARTLVAAPGPGFLPVALAQTLGPFLLILLAVLLLTGLAYVGCGAPSRLAGCFQ